MEASPEVKRFCVPLATVGAKVGFIPLTEPACPLEAPRPIPFHSRQKSVFRLPVRPASDRTETPWARPEARPDRMCRTGA